MLIFFTEQFILLCAKCSVLRFSYLFVFLQQLLNSV
nr:MAG TPA: hypothetical protein [Caudoviricetes sp.]